MRVEVFEEWLRLCVVAARPDQVTGAEEFFQSYLAYCENVGAVPQSKNALARFMTACGVERFDFRFPDGVRKAYMGISLIADEITESVPEIVCTAANAVQVQFVCRWCGKRHRHGLTDGLRRGEREHRISHCSDPDAPRSYYLRLRAN